MQGFLPICRRDMEERGWHELDFVFISGDAAVVLPWDPVRDRVLVVEQFRALECPEPLKNMLLVEAPQALFDFLPIEI